MTNYYYVGALLPELRIGQPVEMKFSEFDRLLQRNLTENDYGKTRIIRRYWDIENFRSYWKKEPLDPRGNLNEVEIEDALIEIEDQPDYIKAFLENHENNQERLKFFPKLMSDYFKFESKQAKGFLKEFLTFQREMRLILVAFRAKKLGRDLSVEFQYEDPDDPLIAQLLVFKDAPTFELPEKYEGLKTIFNEYSDAPMALHQAICEYTFNTVDQMVGLQPFTMDRILGYMVQLSLAEKWLELDKIKGIEIVDRFVKEKA